MPILTFKKWVFIVEFSFEFIDPENARKGRKPRRRGLDAYDRRGCRGRPSNISSSKVTNDL